jgi:hypothetical protein
VWDGDRLLWEIRAKDYQESDDEGGSDRGRIAV